MSVAYVLTEFPALTETFVSDEVTLLRARGLDIVPFTLRAPRFPGDPLLSARSPRDPRALLRLGRRAPGAVRAAGAFIASQLGSAPEAAFAVAVLPRAAAIAEACRALDVQHIHTHFERGAAILAGLVGALAERPWSFSAHAFGLWTSDPGALRERVARARFVRAAHSGAETLLRAMGTSTPIVRVPTPLRFERLPQRGAPDGALLAIARDVPKKGLGQLAELSELLRRRGVRLTPPVIGPSERRLPGLRQLGPLPHPEALRHLSRASAFVAPACVAPDGDRDGLPLALVEAVAMGVPAFATRVAGIADLMAPHLDAHLAYPEDVVQLAERIAAAWDDPAALQRRMALACADVRERFGPEVLAPLAQALLAA